MPELPAGYAVRAATADDLDAIVELFEAYDVWDFGRPDPGREHLEADWVAPGFEPAADSWLVTDQGGGVVGFAYVQGMPTEAARDAFGRVHPGHHGRGIGGFLVRVTEGRARIRPGIRPAKVRNFATATDPSAQALLEDHGTGGSACSGTWSGRSARNATLRPSRTSSCGPCEGARSGPSTR